MAKISAYDQRSEPLAGAVGIIAQPGVKNFKVVNDLIGGWIGVDEAWTYNAANAINVPTGATSRFQKGWGVRFKQSGGTYKYGYINPTAAAVLTLYAGSDYVVANEPISDIAVTPNPQGAFGFPFWFNVGTTLAQGASTDIAKTIILSKFCIEGKRVNWRFIVQATAAGTAGSNISLLLPITSAGVFYDQCGFGFYDDESTATYVGHFAFATQANATQIVLNASSVTTRGAAVGTNPAVTVASNDRFDGQVFYEF